MNNKIKFIHLIAFILISEIALGQSSEIVKLNEKNAYQYKNYYEDGSIKAVIGFYSKNPYSSVEIFEAELKDYKVKYHGERKEYYQSGQLKEIVVYKKGKVVQFMKQYFEDGEEFSVGTETKPEFQFDIKEQNTWFHKKIKDIEEKYEVNLEGKGLIVLEISKDGTIKTVKAKTDDETQEKYLIEIGKQIKVIKPAIKNGQPIGTRFAFRIEL